MSSDYVSYQDRVFAMIGVHLSNGVKDYGTITSYEEIVINASRKYIFITDTGRKIDSGSAMRFMNSYRRKLANAPAIAYPDGTDTVMRRRVMRVKRSGSRSLGGSISNIAKIGDESISISSTVTSAGSFPEEYRESYPNREEK